MQLLKTALFLTLLAAASARPMDWRQHQDADIADNNWTPGWPDDNSRWVSRSSESFSREDSSESSESRSSEESSEEVLVPDVATPTAATGGEGSALTPEPSTPGTDEPTVTLTPTPEPGRQTPATPSCDQCFTVEIPTVAPTTNNRGDN